MDSDSSFFVLNRDHYEKCLVAFIFGGKNQSTLIFAVCSMALISSVTEEIQIARWGRHRDLLMQVMKHSYHITSL